jgi:hypothetical protein
MTDPFTDAELDTLAGQIDAELMTLGTPGTGLARSGGEAKGALSERHRGMIEKATGQNATTFLQRFKAAARKDVCEKGGVLHTQWQKWKDVTNRDVLKTFGGVLVGLGMSGAPLQIAVVAIAAYVLYLGIEAFCAAEF